MEKKMITMLFAAALCLPLTGCDATGTITSMLYGSQSVQQETIYVEGPYIVNRVVDGDTLKLDINGSEMNVRLIGVDTPESVAPKEYLEQTGKQNTDEGSEASAYTKNLMETYEVVWIEHDKETKDKYDRELAYVYLDEEATDMLQERLLAAGMAKCLPIKPNTKYANRFAEIEQTAKAEGVGFWAIDYWN